MRENEKSYKDLNLAKELRKVWNKKVAVIPIVIGALRTISKGLEKGWNS